MPEYTGVAATFGAPPVEANAGADILGFAERLIAVKQAKQQMGMQQVETMLKMASQGFPVDDKAFSKMVKQAKLPISLKDDDLMAQTAVAKNGGGMAGLAKGANSPQQGTQPPTGAANPQSSTANMNPQQKQETWINQMARRARDMMNTKAATEQSKAENEQTIEGLKKKAFAGDNEAVGKLIQANEWKFDMNAETWGRMTPEQKDKAAGIMAGMESDADRAKRATSLSDNMLSSGRFSDPEAASKAGKILAEGGSLSPDLRAKMKPYTFQELADQAKLGNTLVEMGVPANRIGKTIDAAAAGGLPNALPTGMKPLAVESLKLQQAQVGMEGKRLGIEEERFKTETAKFVIAEQKAQRDELRAEDKAELDKFKWLVDAKKSGTTVPQEVQEAIMAGAAKVVGLDTQQVSHWYNFFGGHSLQFTPHLDDGTKSMIEGAAGKQGGIKKPEPSLFKQFMKSMSDKKGGGA